MLPEKPRQELSLAERVRRTLAQRGECAGAAGTSPGASGTQPVSPCLILDVSGSMEEMCEPGRRKIDALRKLVMDLGSAPRSIYAFSEDVELVSAATIPEPAGCTWMHRAFERVKADGCTAAVLITDGLPSVDERIVLAAAKGLHLEIFYVGPPPKPRLLDKLAAMCGGKAQQADLRQVARKQLQATIRGLLTSG